MDPFELQEELQALQDLDSYDIPNEHDVSSMDPRQITQVLEQAIESLAISPESITDPEIFDTYRSVLKYVEHVQGTQMSKLLDSILSAFQAVIDATQENMADEDPGALASRKTTLEIYAFLLYWFVTAADKVKTGGEEDAPVAPTRGKRGRGGKAAGSRAATNKRNGNWSWQDQIPATLSLIAKVFRLKTQRIWQTTGERDTFVGSLTTPVYRIMENEGYMKSETIRLGSYKAICLAVKHHGHALAAQITIMQDLQYYEHLPELFAECLAVLASEYDHTQLCDDILREISSKSFGGAGGQEAKSAHDVKGPRHFSRFLVRLAQLDPRLVLKQMSLLLNQLDSESYPIRIAVVEIIGALIKEIATSLSEANDAEEQPRSHKKDLNTLYDLLLERATDLSSYVRTKVLSTLAKLCHLPRKFPKQRLNITKIAVATLEDKASSVRKNAVMLLVELILTHPYNLSGGLLSLQEWELKYQEICKTIKTLEDAVGKAVQIDGDEAGDDEANEEDGDEEDDSEEEDDDDDEDDAEDDAQMEDDEAGPSRPKKKGKKKRKAPEPSEDSMDIDDEDEAEENEEDDEEDEASDPEAEQDADGEPRAPKRKRKDKGKAKAKRRKPRKSQLNMEALTNEAVAMAALQGTKLDELRLLRKYCSECLNFIRMVEDGMKMIEQLLASTSKAEVLESMEFFRVIYEYKFDGAEAGLKKMLHLIWHKDNSSTSEDGKELKGIRPRLLECYRNIYFDAVPGMEPKQQVNRIAKNMIELTYDATLAELTSLEEMMRIMMDDTQVHHDVINKLWQVYSSERPLPRQQRRGAVIILGMLALARRSVISDRVDVLIKIGLGKLGQADLTLARYTCVALQRLNGSAKKVKGSLLDHNIRLEMDNPLFKKLQEAIERPSRSKDWFAMAEQAINTVYGLAERPDSFCDQLIRNLTRRAFDIKRPGPDPSQAEEQPGEDAMPVDQDDAASIRPDDSAPENLGANASAAPGPEANEKELGDAFALSQLLFVVGHVAIKHIVFLELVEREWKRQKHERDLAEKAKRKSPTRGGAAKDNGEELDQVAGNAEDEIGERVAGIRESELLYGEHSLLATFGPMLVHICGSPHKFKNRTLRAAATLALSKFLCVSSQFCDKHHELLFKILKTSKDASIRSNIVIALGDVAVSFSNIIDENSNELYRGLSDRDIVVKKNTLMVLTHLILNGMIKVKGQLGEMAKCLEDEDERIADLAKLFFTELSTKDNAIYNNLPDVISHLSVGPHAVDEETFQSTMKYIFTFIEKEKQAENIVEKLCQRFRVAEDARQWRDIAFCLSMLPFKSEKSVKKLIDGLNAYQDKLHEPEVFSRFQEILTKARASKAQNKPDAELNDFEKILEDHRRQGQEDNELVKRADAKRAAAKKRANRKQQRKKPASHAEDDE